MSGSRSVPPPLWGDGIRDDLRAEWEREGVALGRDLEGELGIDRHEVIQPDLRYAAFSAVAAREMPTAVRFPATSPERYPDDWDAQVREARHRDYAVGLRVSRGLLLSCGVEDWRSLTPLLLEIKDSPDRVRARMTSLARFAAQVLETAYAAIDFDFVLFSEPIASNAAPVISAEDFLSVCRDAYSGLVDQARSNSVRHVVFQTYGNTPALLPAFIECGATAFWSGDVAQSRVAYPAIREHYGSELGLIGGLDMGILRLSNSEMERALEEFLTPLVRSGRYLPLLDGRVRSGVPFRSYRTYREHLARTVANAFVTGV